MYQVIASGFVFILRQSIGMKKAAHYIVKWWDEDNWCLYHLYDHFLGENVSFA